MDVCLTPLGRSIDPELAKKLRKRKGLCIQCGRTRTHRRSMMLSLEPITTSTQEFNSGNRKHLVYHGHCLNCEKVEDVLRNQAVKAHKERMGVPQWMEAMINRQCIGDGKFGKNQTEVLQADVEIIHSEPLIDNTIIAAAYVTSEGLDNETKNLINTFKKVEVRDRTYYLKNYNKCFIGKEAVDNLVNSRIAKSRHHAVQLGYMLQNKYVLFDHVCNDHDFQDSHLFFRFKDDVSYDLETTDVISKDFDEEQSASITNNDSQKDDVKDSSVESKKKSFFIFDLVESKSIIECDADAISEKCFEKKLSINFEDFKLGNIKRMPSIKFDEVDYKLGDSKKLPSIKFEEVDFKLTDSRREILAIDQLPSVSEMDDNLKRCSSKEDPANEVVDTMMSLPITTSRSSSLFPSVRDLGNDEKSTIAYDSSDRSIQTATSKDCDESEYENQPTTVAPQDINIKNVVQSLENCTSSETNHECAETTVINTLSQLIQIYLYETDATDEEMAEHMHAALEKVLLLIDKNHKNVPIVTLCVRALMAFTVSTDGGNNLNVEACNLVIVYEVVDYVVKAMNANPNSCELLRYSMKLLRNIGLASPDTANTKIVQACDFSGISRIIGSMYAHPQCKIIQDDGCALLLSLCNDDVSNRRMVAESFGVTAILIALDTFRGDESVQEHACGALQSLSKEENISEGILSNGGLKSLFVSLSEHVQCESIARQACLTLYKIFLTKERMDIKSEETKVDDVHIGALFVVLEMYMESEDVISCVCYILRQLAESEFNVEVMQRQQNAAMLLGKANETYPVSCKDLTDSIVELLI